MVALGTPTELKHKSMKGELLLVEAQPLGARLTFCKRLPVLWMPLFSETRYTWLCESREQRSGSAQPTSRQNGVTVGNMEAIRPTLEDVFVSLTTESAQRTSVGGER